MTQNAYYHYTSLCHTLKIQRNEIAAKNLIKKKAWYLGLLQDSRTKPKQGSICSIHAFSSFKLYLTHVHDFKDVRCIFLPSIIFQITFINAFLLKTKLNIPHIRTNDLIFQSWVLLVGSRIKLECFKVVPPSYFLTFIHLFSTVK